MDEERLLMRRDPKCDWKISSILTCGDGVWSWGRRQDQRDRDGKARFLKNNQVDSFFWSDVTWLEEVQFYLFNLELVYLFTYEVYLPTLCEL